MYCNVKKYFVSSIALKKPGFKCRGTMNCALLFLIHRQAGVPCFHGDRLCDNAECLCPALGTIHRAPTALRFLLNYILVLI